MQDDDLEPTLVKAQRDFSAPTLAPSRWPIYLPWAGIIGLVGGGIAFAALVFLPQRQELNDTKQLWNEARQANANLDEKVGELQTVREELEAAKATLAAEVEDKEKKLAAIHATQDELSNKLKEEIDKGNVLIKQIRGQLVLDLVDRILFNSGEAELNDQGKEVLLRVASTLIKVEDKYVQVGGHTDALPIAGKLLEQFPTNWELSAARALHVVRFLEEEGKVPGSRLVVTSFSQHRPIATNATRTGRRRNRRIEVTLVPIPLKEKKK